MSSLASRLAMTAALLSTALLPSTILASSAADAASRQPRTIAAAIAAAKALDEAGCDQTYEAQSSAATAKRGMAWLVATGDTYCGGAGAQLMMAYSGSRWGYLTAEQDVWWPRKLPTRVYICQRVDGYTNLRAKPTMKSRVVARVYRQTKVKTGALKLTKVPSSWAHEGQGWFRVKYHGRTAWVRNDKIVGTAVGSSACHLWRQ